MSPGRPRPRIVTGVIAAFGLAAATALAARMPALLLVNETASVPRGLYLRSRDPEPRLERLVTIAQPAGARGYLARLGVPAEMRLLKRVSAVGGQWVCAQDGLLETPRRRVAVLSRDRRGVPLPVWRDCRRLAGDELLLLGDSPTSFDGRYFGPTPRHEVEAAYSEVLRW